MVKNKGNYLFLNAGTFYVNDALIELIFDELKTHCSSGGYGGFLPAVKQIANVAALPGIMKCSIGIYHNFL